MTKQSPSSNTSHLSPPQRVHTLIWIMFLLQVPPVINGVPFRTMAKSGLYWLTLIIDSRRPLPWFMIVCYFYISCQIHLVYPGPGSAPQTVNIQHCIGNPPPPKQPVWALFSSKVAPYSRETCSSYLHNRFRKESLRRRMTTKTGKGNTWSLILFN